MYEELIKRLRRCASYDPRFVIQNCEDAANAIEELSRRCEQFQYMPSPAWIPVTERFPERDIDVLVFAIGKIDGFLGDHVIAIARRCIFRLVSWVDGEETWSDPWRFFHTDYEITHWMPLPTPPKDGE